MELRRLGESRNSKWIILNSIPKQFQPEVVMDTLLKGNPYWFEQLGLCAYNQIKQIEHHNWQGGWVEYADGRITWGDCLVFIRKNYPEFLKEFIQPLTK